jgi:parallel beta-helix repeat protein
MRINQRQLIEILNKQLFLFNLSQSYLVLGILMKFDNHNRILFLTFTITVLFFIVSIQNDNLIVSEIIEAEDKSNYDLKKSDFWSNFTFIHITDSNWSVAASYDWCKGNGTWSNPYVIENLTINASTSPTGSGIFIENSTNVYFVIRNVTVTNTGTNIYDGGIKLDNTSNGTLILNNCSNTEQTGIILRNTCINNTIKFNELNFNQWYGIGGYGLFENLTIANNSISNNQRLGIYTTAFRFVEIANNTFQDNIEEGYFMTNSYNNTFYNNYFYSNSRHGLYLGGNSNNNTILDNIFESNTWNGIYLENNNDNFILNNTFQSNSRSGLYLDNADDSKISNNKIFNNQDYGIHLDVNSENNLIFNNTIENIASIAQEYGIEIDTSNYNVIKENTIRNNNWYGIHVLDSINTQIYNNSILGSTNQNDGIVLQGSTQHTLIKDNSIEDNIDNALETLASVYNTSFISNKVINNLIYLSSANRTILSGNNLTNCGVLLDSSLDLLMTNIIYPNNTVNNKPLYYYKDQIGLNNSNFTNPGQILLLNCSNVNITYMNISNTDIGIGLYYTNDSYIAHNTLSELYYGLHLDQCIGINIFNNSIDNGAGTDYGIYLDNYCKNITIRENDFFNSYYGIRMFDHCDNNTIFNNTFNSHYQAIRLQFACDYNNISNNQNFISINYGIYIYSSNHNYVYNNIIINNPGDNGIYLFFQSTFNKIIKNYIAYCQDTSYGFGIYLEDQCNNNDLVNNTSVYNEMDGIRLGEDSHNNNIIGNNVSYNLDYGIYIGDVWGTCDDNTLAYNYIDNNGINGIHIYDGLRTIIYNNTILNNPNRGIAMRFGNNQGQVFNNSISFSNWGIQLSSSQNLISFNKIFNCTYGIYLFDGAFGGDNNNITKNIISNCSDSGIRFDNSVMVNNRIIENIIKNNTWGLYLESWSPTQNNYILLNHFLSNGIHAQDDNNVGDNFFDNGSIGNYWDNYGALGGYDLNDNGIGDIPYNITGTIGISDNYPIWDDGDDIAPIVNVNAPTNLTYSNVPPTINVVFSDKNNDTIWYELAGTNFTLINNTNLQLNPGAWNTLLQGEYIVYIFANDTAGNINNSLTLTLYKDTQAPEIVINTPLNESYSSTPPFLNITVYDPNNQSLWFEFVGINYTIYNNTNQQLNVGDWNGLAEGPYQVYIYANDTYGYLNDSLTLTLYKDLAPPSVYIHSLENNTYHDTAPFINVSYSDPNNDSLWYEISGIPYTLPNYTNHQINAGAWGSLPEGQFIVYIFANDTVGNVNDTFSFIFYKDLSNPDVFIHSFDNNSYHNTAPFINVSFSDPNYDSLWYEILGIPYTLPNYTNHQINAGAWGSLSEGQFIVYVFANDTAGKLNDTYRFVFNKDLTNPDVFIHSIFNNSYYNTAPTISCSFSDPNNDSLWYEISGITYTLPNYTDHQIDAGAWASLGQVQFTIYIFANDTGGNVNNTFRFIFYKDTNPPARDMNYPSNGAHFTSAPVLNIWVGDPNLDSTWYIFEGGRYDFSSNVDIQIDSGVWAGLDAGVYYVYIYANDTFGQEATALVLTIYKDAGEEPPPPFDPFLIIILLIIIGIIAVALIAFLRTKSSKKPQGLEIRAKKKTTAEYKRTTQVKTPKPKPKPSQAGEALSAEQLAAISQETQKTREEMLIEEKEDVCPVHKGPIVGIMYACPKCKTKYCMKCARTLVQKNEGCWACNEPISFFDEDLNPP